MKHLMVMVLSFFVGISVCSDALARRGHGGSFGRSPSIHRSHTVVAGGSVFLFSPWWWGSAYRPAYVPNEPIVYIEQSKVPEAYWYYCTQPAGYYPEVAGCPGGWLQVMPQTAGAEKPQ